MVIFLSLFLGCHKSNVFVLLQSFFIVLNIFCWRNIESDIFQARCELRFVIVYCGVVEITAQKVQALHHTQGGNLKWDTFSCSMS